MYKEVWEEGNCEGVFIIPLISYTQYSQMNRKETNIMYAFMVCIRVSYRIFWWGEEVCVCTASVGRGRERRGIE